MYHILNNLKFAHSSIFNCTSNLSSSLNNYILLIRRQIYRYDRCNHSITKCISVVFGISAFNFANMNILHVVECFFIKKWMLKDPFEDIFVAIYAVKIDVTWSLSDLMSSELIIHVLLDLRPSLVKRFRYLPSSSFLLLGFRISWNWSRVYNLV